MKQLITIIALLIISNTAYPHSMATENVGNIYRDYNSLDSLAEHMNSTLDSHFTENYFYIFYSFSTNSKVLGIAMGDFKQGSDKAILLSFDKDNVRIDAKSMTSFDVGIVETLYNSVNNNLLENTVNHSLTIERQCYRDNDFIFSGFRTISDQQIYSFIHFGTFYFGQKNTDLHSLYIICYDLLIRLSQ